MRRRYNANNEGHSVCNAYTHKDLRLWNVGDDINFHKSQVDAVIAYPIRNWWICPKIILKKNLFTGIASTGSETNICSLGSHELTQKKLLVRWDRKVWFRKNCLLTGIAWTCSEKIICSLGSHQLVQKKIVCSLGSHELVQNKLFAYWDRMIWLRKNFWFTGIVWTGSGKFVYLLGSHKSAQKKLLVHWDHMNWFRKYCFLTGIAWTGSEKNCLLIGVARTGSKNMFGSLGSH